MALITDQPEDLATTDALTDVEDPDAVKYSGERAELYVSGAHVCTLDDAPSNRQRITMMVDLEVFEETTRANGDEDVPVRKARRIGDMYLPGTERPPSKDELKAMQAAAKAKAAAEAAAREEAERAEAEHNEPPMFDEDGNAISDDAPKPAGDDGWDQDTADAINGPEVDQAIAGAEDQADIGPAFSDGAK